MWLYQKKNKKNKNLAHIIDCVAMYKRCINAHPFLALSSNCQTDVMQTELLLRVSAGTL
jgi:hypothetical protein